MHRILTLLLLAVSLSSPALAQSGAKDSLCARMYTLAATIMEVRQNETSIPDLLETLSGGSKDPANILPVIKRIVFSAYERPAYQTPSNKRREILEFANEVYLDCAKNMPEPPTDTTARRSQ